MGENKQAGAYAGEGRRVALVTGGGRGIGRAICLELARGGCNVVIDDVGDPALTEGVAEECRTLGVEAVAEAADITDSEQVGALIARIVEQFGHLDILVNNAGITKDALAVQMSDDQFDAVINVNLKGSFVCMRAAGKQMMRQRYGRIVNVSSVVALHGNPGQMNYVASKSGVIGMTMTLARELGKRGVTVNAVAPGFIDTDMTRVLPEKVVEGMLATVPLARAGQPEDVARVVAFLASDDAAYVSGQVVRVDGGMGM